MSLSGPLALPSRPKPRTMAQKPRAQAIRKRKATLKLARLKEGASETKTTKPASKTATAKK